MVTIPPSLPDKDDLERQQLYLTNEKLKVETDKLEQDAKPEKWWSKLGKTVLAFGGVVTVAATIYGIWDSYNKTIDDREKTRISDQRTRFEDAIKRLESSSTISKLVGVSVLSGYLGPADKTVHRQILFILAGLMATEKDFQTQAAVIDLIASVPNDGSITPAEWQYFQNMLITQSRALMTKGDLLHKRRFGATSPFSDEEQTARTVGKLIAINVRHGRVSDYKNYRGIYCADCDLRGAVFPAKVDFTGAVLDGADFSGATMEAAIFDNAELSSTKFVETDLRMAQFRSLDESVINASANDQVPFGRTGYLDNIASALDVNAVVNIKMPNYSCANLEGAHFDHHALFPGVILVRRKYTKSDQTKPGWYQSVPQYVKDNLQFRAEVEFRPARVLPPKFFKANIKDVHFEQIRFFALFSAVDFFPTYMGDGQYHRVAEFNLDQGLISDGAFQVGSENGDGNTAAPKNKAVREEKERVNADLEGFQNQLRAAFYSAEFNHAFLPTNAMDFLKRSNPTLDDYQSVFRSFQLVTGDDTDLKCAPRQN